MKRLYAYSVSCPHGSTAHREALAKVDPEGFQGQSFNIELSEDDPKRRFLEGVLHELGLVADTLGERQDNRRQCYSLRVARCYSDADLLSAPFLQVFPSDGWGNPSEPVRKGDELLAVRPGRIKGKRRCILAHHTRIPIVPDDVRRGLQSAGLIGVDFRETLVCPQFTRTSTRLKSWAECGRDPWWEIRSVVELPPVSPSMTTTRTPLGERLPRGSTEFCGFREGNYIRPELHYLRSDVERFPDFDLACTLERFAWSPLNRHLIASQRFYRFCLDHNIKCDWIPVRIDEG